MTDTERDSTRIAPPDDSDRQRIRNDLDHTLFVEAGAGAGKTSSLVDRVVNLVETGVPITDTRNQYLAYHDGRTGFLRGTWRSKSWLIRIAGEVEQRALMYDQQLRSCRKR